MYEDEETKMVKILISIIMIYGDKGLPLNKVEKEFINYCGFSVPYKKFDAENLRSWILTLPDIYIVQNENKEEVLIQQSPKSLHIKALISKQKKQIHYSNNKRKYETTYANQRLNKRPKDNDFELPKECFIHNSINNTYINNYERHDSYRKLESMLPLFYKHQALGDDFFLDIADTKLGYYVPETGPKECGLCVAGQTIAELTERVRQATHLAPRVVVNIGFTDLIQGRNVNNMIHDLNQLINELKGRNIRVTLITLVPSPKLPKNRKLEIRMDIFNRALWDYAYSADLKCNIIDMNMVFYNEAQKFQRETDRFMKVAKKDNYRVFSDYGRKVFLNTIKYCLKYLIESGH